MNVLLLNIDSKLPNIALHKIAMWHGQQGNNIIWDGPAFPNEVSKVYASCILTKNKYKVDEYKQYYPNLVAGGTGYDLSTKLPPDIDTMKPKINYGFTSRGCIRRCEFCLVPLSEGTVKPVGDIYDIWDGKSKELVLFDNNILALPDHFRMVCSQLVKEGLKIDFNQGLDIRLLTEEYCNLLNQLKLSNGLRFAFDNISLEPLIREKVALLRESYTRKYIFFYVLVGFNSTFEEDLYRLNVIKELGYRAYVMRHQNTPKEKRYTRMAQWANQFWTFAKYDFETFCKKYDAYNKRTKE